jgi:hypothetical protein
MKKFLAWVVAVVVMGLVLVRVLNTFGYLNGALTGGGQTAGTVPPIDPAEVTVERVAGRWLRHPNPKADDEVLALDADGRFEWWTCVNGVVPAGQTPDRGTWALEDGSVMITTPKRFWLGRVTYLMNEGTPKAGMVLTISGNGATENYERVADDWRPGQPITR